MKVVTGRPGRPREFDIDDATRDAMEVFWKQGFHATSLPDLIEGMGLTRGSIYKAYDDKRSIYLAALDTFIDMRLDRLEKMLAKPDKRSALKDVLRQAGKEAASVIGRKGCFTTAATIEMVQIDQEVEERLAEMYATMENMLTTAIDVGKEDGAVTTRMPSASLARLLVCTFEGMAVLGKLGPSERASQKLASTVATLLD